MTPQTRALIEAAEEAKQILNDAGNSSFSDSIIEAINILEAAISSAKAAEEGVEGKTFNTEQVFSCAEIGELCCEWGSPEYVITDDGEAWYWRFSGHDLPVADNLSELFMAAQQLAKEQYHTGEQVLNEL